MSSANTPALAKIRHPSYLGVFLTFARNSLVRDMTFRGNFLIECVTSVTWMAMNLGFYLIIFKYTRQIAGWDQYEFFAFLSTTMIVNSLVQSFFMPNCEEVSELIRTGGLDFALLKPIDTQFLISLRKVEWAGLSNFFAGVILLSYSLVMMAQRSDTPLILSPQSLLLYTLFCLCGVAIMYSVMISLAATSIWLGQNRSLYDFWFYITNFSRYPMEIYEGPYGRPLRMIFTFVLPILLVVNVPARVIAWPFGTDAEQSNLTMYLAVFTLFATGLSLLASRWLFTAALRGYRSASS
ncbi:ABC transporter permease [Anatilimnocola floriformis]|uniref:ABC transporter permease n=1 Tax=Anatilimnocola floriformis TaxID=2948575 RepID=UPI0020C29675|nr:ABC-2 family transporter protein [Anatilimnocola floriformis]